MKPDPVEQAVMHLNNEFRSKGKKGVSLDAARGGCAPARLPPVP